MTTRRKTEPSRDSRHRLRRAFGPAPYLSGGDGARDGPVAIH